MVGAWKLSDMVPCNLPEKVATGFGEALDGLVGATYIPILYCGEQLVHGTNYMLICRQTLTTKESEEHVVKMILHNHLPSDAEPAWTLISIDSIC